MRWWCVSDVFQCGQPTTTMIRGDAAGVRGLAAAAAAAQSSKLRRQLLAAIANGDPQLLRQLLANDLDASSFVAHPDLLHRACAAGNRTNVALLLRYGANVNGLAQTDRYRVMLTMDTVVSTYSPRRQQLPTCTRVGQKVLSLTTFR